MNKKRLVDILIVILLFLTAFLAYDFVKEERFLSGVFRNNEDAEVKESVSVEEDNDLSKRKYPSHFTEEMILTLVPQTDEVGKEEHRRWDETLREIAEDADTLRLYKYENDCFGDPLVMRVKRGEAISVKNDADSEITFGMGEQNWNIEAGGTIEIVPEFEIYPETKLEENPYGYGCGGPFENAPSGLFLVR